MAFRPRTDADRLSSARARLDQMRAELRLIFLASPDIMAHIGDVLLLPNEEFRLRIELDDRVTELVRQLAYVTLASVFTDADDTLRLPIEEM